MSIQNVLSMDQVLPGAGVQLEMFETKEKSVAAKDMIRTDANLQKIEKFFNNSTTSSEPAKPVQTPSNNKISDNEIVNLSQKTDLTSVYEIKSDILNSCSPECRNVIANHTFVGCVDRGLALFQYETKLFLVNTNNLTKLLFRQIIFTQFGQLPVLRLCPPPKVL